MKSTAFSIYNASAGSGKTFSLVKEYLKILLKAKKNDAYKKILAITFTNKAVFEMKTRIIDSLFDFSKDNPSDKSLHLMEIIGNEIVLTNSEIKHKAQLIIKNIIHNYAAFDISTIDKFTLKVIRSFAFDLGLASTFDTSTDTENLLQEAVDSIISQAGEDEVLTKLLVEFTIKKTDEDKSWDVSTEIFNTGKLILNENNRKEVLYVKDKDIPEYILLKKRLENLCLTLNEECVVLANKAIHLLELHNINPKSFSRSTFPNHLDYIKNSDLKPTHKKYRKIEDISINKGSKDKDKILRISDELLYILNKIYSNYEKKDFYSAFLINITPLSLLSKLNNELTKIQKEQNILSISEFNNLIFEHIQNQPAPFIYERLGEKYKHFFIDEFQDTSEMQWHNLIPLIDNALSSEDLSGTRGSLMIVGDPKQSIYRWRGGKAEQFINLTKNENPFSNKDKKIFNLESNFRSYNQIIRFNNSFFKFLSSKFLTEDYKELYKNQSAQKTNSKKGGYVNISFIPELDTLDFELDDEPNKNEIYLNATLLTIEKICSEGFSLNEIVILTRNNKQGVLLAKYLTEKSYPVISSESLLLNSSSEVKFILNTLRYIQDPSDKESLTNILYYFAKNQDNKIEVHEFILQGLQHIDDLSLELWLLSFDILLSFERIRKKGLYEISEQIVTNCIPISKNNAYVQYFLDIVLEKDIKYQMSVLDFLEYWNNNGLKLSIPSSDGTNAIRIMTIHKSKGLEFPVVIFPFAEENYSASKKEKIWIETKDPSLNFDKFLIDKSSRITDYGENASNIYLNKTQEDLLDNINVLYVALTRAEEQLYIISNIKNRNKSGELPNNLASFFIEFLENENKFEPNILNFEFGNKNRMSLQKPFENKQKYIETIKEVLDHNAIKIAKRESLMWGSNQQKAIEYGNIIHEILSYIKSNSDINLAIIKALEDGLITEKDKTDIEQTIIEIVNHKELKCFFEKDNTVLNEQLIIKKGASAIKPDRICIRDKNAYLLDYKTGKKEPKHIQQLSDYELVLQSMGFQVKKKALIYIGEKIEILHL